MHMPIVYGPVKSINLKKKLKSKAKKKSKEAGTSSQAEVWTTIFLFAWAAVAQLVERPIKGVWLVQLN